MPITRLFRSNRWYLPLRYLGSIELCHRLKEGKQRQLHAQLLPLRPSCLFLLVLMPGLFHHYIYLTRGHPRAVKRAGRYRTESIGIVLNRPEDNTGGWDLLRVC
jgi:hypothetical protein